MDKVFEAVGLERTRDEIIRDQIQAAAYREIVALLAATPEPNAVDPFIVDVAALINKTHKEVMKRRK